MKNKIKIIDEICKKHPSYGVDAGFSCYVGGMADTGHWYFRDMLDRPIMELRSFLRGIKEQENRPKQKLTGQDLKDSKKIHHLSNSQFVSELDLSIMKKLQEAAERKLLFNQ